MKKNLGRVAAHGAAALLMALLLALRLAHAQTPAPGNTVQTSVITSYAPAGPSIPGQIVCALANAPANPLSVNGTCAQGTTSWAFSLPVLPVGVGNGATNTFVSGGNSISYLIQQLTAGVISWQVVANGSMSSGTL
jgi:hypothetical protein